jgi:hypothetical protein
MPCTPIAAKTPTWGTGTSATARRLLRRRRPPRPALPPPLVPPRGAAAWRSALPGPGPCPAQARTPRPCQTEPAAGLLLPLLLAATSWRAPAPRAAAAAARVRRTRPLAAGGVAAALAAAVAAPCLALQKHGADRQECVSLERQTLHMQRTTKAQKCAAPLHACHPQPNHLTSHCRLKCCGQCGSQVWHGRLLRLLGRLLCRRRGCRRLWWLLLAWWRPRILIVLSPVRLDKRTWQQHTQGTHTQRAVRRHSTAVEANCLVAQHLARADILDFPM